MTNVNVVGILYVRQPKAQMHIIIIDMTYIL